MSVTVIFRGVMLFDTTKDGEQPRVLRSVRIPYCLRPPLGGSEKGDQLYHLDGTLAVPHHAGIMVTSSHYAPSYYPLRDARVEIGDTSKALEIGNVVETLADVGNVKDASLELRSDTRPATIVTLGPVPDAEKKKVYKQKRNFKVGKQEHLSHVLTLEYSDEVQVLVSTHSDAKKEIPIPEGATVYVYSFDEPFPTESQLTDDHDTTAKFVIDHDFKWLYPLLQPSDGTSLEEWAAGNLPAPLWMKDGRDPSAITIFTCFPAMIQGAP